MPTPTAERDLSRARDLRKLAKGVADGPARQDFTNAALRLEARAGRSARKIGTKRRKRSATGSFKANP